MHIICKTVGNESQNNININIPSPPHSTKGPTNPHKSLPHANAHGELKAKGVSFRLFNEKRCHLHSPVHSQSYHNILFVPFPQTVYISLFRWSHHVPIITPTKDKRYVLSLLLQHYNQATFGSFNKDPLL